VTALLAFLRAIVVVAAFAGGVAVILSAFAG
jgi:hypothetical protein